MNDHMNRKILAFLLAFGAVLLLVLPAIAQTGGGYDLAWHTVDSGGTFNMGGSYTLGGTIGQPDAGRMAGGDYVLSGGFWSGGEVLEPVNQVFMPLIRR